MRAMHKNKIVCGLEEAVRGEVGALTVFLPFPPSVNNLFKNVGRSRKPSADYLAWQEEAGWALKGAGAHRSRVSGAVRIDLLLSPPDKRRRDLDNLAKAPLDLIVKHGLIEDDSKVTELRLRWHPDAHHGCTIIIRQCAA